jgi:HAD superfamily hydrolase (TIGR01490 family)
MAANDAATEADGPSGPTVHHVRDTRSPPLRSRPLEAAFFDLDKTVIAKASMVAFSRPFQRAGLLNRRLLLRAAWGQLVYMYLGASEEKLAKLRDRVLRLTQGWDQAEVSAIVRETLEDVIEPIIFDEALDLIRDHQAAGRKVFIVSASPEEIVAPLAQHLGVDEAIATRAELDDLGRYTGRTELYCYGPDKAVAMAEVARRDGIDLAASYAYSDSATDIPMLECVGHAVAVNPDRELARAARDNGWEVQRFTRRVRLRDRVPMPSARQSAAVGGGAALAAGAAAAVWWLRREQLRARPSRAAVVRRFGPSSPLPRPGRRARSGATASSWRRIVDRPPVGRAR